MNAVPFPIAPGVYVFQGEGDLGGANAGAVVDLDGVTVIDTLMIESQWEPFATGVEAFERPVPRVVLTSSHMQYVGGTGRFWPAAFYGSAHTSDQLELPPNVVGYRRLMPRYAAEIPDEPATRGVSHTVDGDAPLTPAIRLRLARGPSAGNVMADVPGAGVLFAGAVAVFGAVPLGFEADPAAWWEELDRIADAGPIVVPGQGPIGGVAEVRELQRYLEACDAADGDVRRLAEGPWLDWLNPEFHAVNVERAALLARGEDRPPDAMLRLVGLLPS